MVRHPRYVPVLRNRLIRVQAIAYLESRLDELESGVAEHRRQVPALQRHLDDLERDLVSVLAARSGRGATR